MSEQRNRRHTAKLRQWAGVWARLLIAGGVMLALQITPQTQAAWEAGRQARLLASAGDHPAAIAALDRVLAYQPWSADDLAFKARQEQQAGDTSSALMNLEQLARLRPLRNDETVTLAAIYLQQGRAELADGLLGEAAAQARLDSAALDRLVSDAFHEQDWWTASAALEGLALIHPDDAATLARLGLAQALDQPERGAATLSRVGALDSRLGAQIVGVQAALTARSNQPPDRAYATLGANYLSLNEYELAESALARAYDLNPAYGEALAYLALARAKLGKPALGAMQQAVALAPDSPLVNYLAGLTWKTLGRPLEARAAFERAYDLDPRNPAVAVEIANTHRAEGGNAFAETWLKEAVRLSGGDLRFRLLLAQFYVDENYLVAESGLPLAQQLVIEAPDSAEAHDALGWAYFLSGGLDRASEQLTRALALDPALARAHTHMGALLEAQGNPGDAISQYRLAVELDSKGAFGALARRALERLGQTAP